MDLEAIKIISFLIKNNRLTNLIYINVSRIGMELNLRPYQGHSISTAKLESKKELIRTLQDYKAHLSKIEIPNIQELAKKRREDTKTLISEVKDISCSNVNKVIDITNIFFDKANELIINNQEMINILSKSIESSYVSFERNIKVNHPDLREKIFNIKRRFTLTLERDLNPRAHWYLEASSLSFKHAIQIFIESLQKEISLGSPEKIKDKLLSLLTSSLLHLYAAYEKLVFSQLFTINPKLKDKIGFKDAVSKLNEVNFPSKHKKTGRREVIDSIRKVRNSLVHNKNECSILELKGYIWTLIIEIDFLISNFRELEPSKKQTA